MTDSAPNRCCAESRQNIPWYVNGTLSVNATAALREHLEHCGDCTADLKLHTEMRASVLGRELTPIQPATTAEDILGKIERESGQRVVRASGMRRLAAVAAGIVILGVSLFLLLFPINTVETDNQLFQTATSGGPAGSIDYVLEVQFDEQVSQAERARIAAELEGAVKWAVNDRGVYEVHVRLAAPSLQVLQEYEELTGSITGVQSARFTALQLPVR
ncbi:MAG: anti-sigma factor [Gammaproteobacteria bacterium]|nr:anti-sigma factor [Gammaproteobacteria bacterium]